MRRRAWAVALLLLGAATMRAGEARASLADSLCNPFGSAALSAYPSTSTLDGATAQLETGLRRRGPSDPFRELMPALDPPVSADHPSPAALVDYCTAAGELMRVSPQGSQQQAQYYLIAAFQAADRAGLRDGAALAAYRLGLVSLSGQTVSGARGRKATRGGAGAALQNAVSVEGADPCGLLLSPGALANTNLTLSLASLECSADQARAAGGGRTAALAYLQIARLKLQVAQARGEAAVGFRAQAAAAAMTGLGVARSIDDAGLRAEVLGRLASAALDAGQPPSAQLVAVVGEIRAAAPADMGASALADAITARLAFAAGDAATARQWMAQAMLHESQRPLPERMPQWRLLLAEMDPALREAHVLAAYDALEAIRPLLPRFDPLTEETAFSLYMRPVFQSAVDVQLAGAQGDQAAIRVRGAQQIVEAYRQAELQSVFGSECIPAHDALRPETLAAGEVILYPILLPDRLELLYLAGGADGAATFRRLPPNRTIDRQAIAALVETVIVSLANDNDDSWRAASRRLYDLLIAPVEADLKPGSVLAVVPDGALRGLPFAALLDRDNHFLIEKTRITVAPSLAYSQPGGLAKDTGLQLVAASLEMEVKLPSGDFEKLSGTANEAKAAAVVDGRRIERAWVIENFKKADLVQALTNERVDVLHLATHASFNGRSDRAFIVANGEVILLSELRQILSVNRNRGEELDLLVLSACETAVGDDEASMGLAGAAVQAGARSAIASLWPVNDVGTAQLMKGFYQFYRDGRSKSAALRDAQLAMIGAGGPAANPNIWAAFTLLGAWR